MQPGFKTYANNIIANAKTLADDLMALGWRLVSGGTDNHMLLIDLRSRLPQLNGHQAADWLATAGIICNWNKIPFDTRSALETSGIRLGTPALTTRGMGKNEMKQLAVWIDTVLKSCGKADVLKSVNKQVLELCAKFPVPNYNL